MRKPVTEAEFRRLPTTAARDKVIRAFNSRCERAGKMERQNGLRRVDFLGGDSIFTTSMIGRHAPDMRVLSSLVQSAETQPLSTSKDVKSEIQIDKRSAKRPSEEASPIFRSSFAEPETESGPQGTEDDPPGPSPEPYPTTDRASASGNASTQSDDIDTKRTSTTSPQHGHQSRGGSMFSGAQNTIINDGHFVVSESVDITIHTTCTTHHDSPQAHAVPESILLAFPAALGEVHAHAMLPHQEFKPMSSEVGMQYRPIYYEDFPVFFAPLLFVYLWRFVFGSHSLRRNVF